MIAIILLLPVIFMTGCSSSESKDNAQEYNDSAPDNKNADNTLGESTTESVVKNRVVAIVNDEEVESEEVSEIQRILLQQGQEISEEEALEQVINQKILEQKVQQEDIVITNEESESVIKEQLAMQGATLDDYKQQVESQGTSYEAELENLKNQIAIQNYLEAQLEDKSFDVSEEEAQEFYEMHKAQSVEEVPPYEELQRQISASLEQQKRQEAIGALIQELKTDANVEYK